MGVTLTSDFDQTAALPQVSDLVVPVCLHVSACNRVASYHQMPSYALRRCPTWWCPCGCCRATWARSWPGAPLTACRLCTPAAGPAGRTSSGCGKTREFGGRRMRVAACVWSCSAMCSVVYVMVRGIATYKMSCTCGASHLQDAEDEHVQQVPYHAPGPLPTCRRPDTWSGSPKGGGDGSANVANASSSSTSRAAYAVARLEPALRALEDSNNATCRNCPSNARCGGGAVLVPLAGYWHSAPNSTLMHRYIGALGAGGLRVQGSGFHTACFQGFDWGSGDGPRAAAPCPACRILRMISRSTTLARRPASRTAPEP